MRPARRIAESQGGPTKDAKQTAAIAELAPRLPRERPVGRAVIQSHALMAPGRSDPADSKRPPLQNHSSPCDELGEDPACRTMQLDMTVIMPQIVFSGQRQRSLIRHTSQRGLRARQV